MSHRFLRLHAQALFMAILALTNAHLAHCSEAPSFNFSLSDDMTADQILKESASAEKFIRQKQLQNLDQLKEQLKKDPQTQAQLLKATILFSVATASRQNLKSLAARKQYWDFIAKIVDDGNLSPLATVLKDFPLDKLTERVASTLASKQSYHLQILQSIPRKLLLASPEKLWIFCGIKKNWLSAIEYEDCLQDYFNSIFTLGKSFDEKSLDSIFNNLLVTGIDINDSKTLKNLLQRIQSSKMFKVESSSFLTEYYTALLDLSTGAAEKGSSKILSLSQKAAANDFSSKVLRVAYSNSLIPLKKYSAVKDLFLKEKEKKGFTFLRLQSVYIRSLLLDGKLEDAHAEIQKVTPYPQLPSFYFSFFNEFNSCLIGVLKPSLAEPKKCWENYMKFYKDASEFNISNTDVKPFLQLWNTLLRGKINSKSADVAAALKMARSLPRIQPTLVLLEKISSSP